MIKSAGLLIYSPHITSRLQYIVRVLFREQAGITANTDEYILHAGPCINYSSARLRENECLVQPYGLLHETGIREQEIPCFQWNGHPVFFAAAGDIPFDIFSASFYLVSRYEEYLPCETDAYGRYPHTAGIAYRQGFLQQPLVNYWITELEKILQRQGPCALPALPFSFVPTYDIDSAFAYAHRPILQNVAGFYADLLKADIEKAIERGRVYTGRINDPFDTFDWLNALHEEYGLKPIYFCLTLLKKGKHDRNLYAHSRALKALYRRLSTRHTMGLHPSWQSGTDEWLMEKELEVLQDILQKPVTASRQHYLRFTLPHTYRQLIRAGITDDYSMAYATINGFRASYAAPFKWYDLRAEETTGLTLHPFSYMEANSFFEQKYTAAQAAEELEHYEKIIRQTGGEFITLFHNHFLTAQKQWLPWRKMYEAFLRTMDIGQ